MHLECVRALQCSIEMRRIELSVYSSELYTEDVKSVYLLSLPWEKLANKVVLLSGATGMIGSFFTDVIMEKNKQGLDCTIFALTRSPDKAKNRFLKFVEDEHLKFIPYDVKNPLDADYIDKVDFVLHLASNTHPLQYSTDPIGTITTNIIGLQNLLDFSVQHAASRFVFASSNEVYGENRGDVELFDEGYCGYINCNTLRAGYPESKRCGEALCQAYIKQTGLDVVIPRFTRTYGPTMLMSDTKAISQFIKKGIAGEDIVLKSAGNQYYSYEFVADSVSGLLTTLLLGNAGESYNIADENSDIRLKDLAQIIAEAAGRKVIFELPDNVEAAGYSTATKARLDGRKLMSLGWKPQHDIRTGILRTMTELKQIYGIFGGSFA